MISQDIIDLQEDPLVERREFKDLMKKILCLDPDSRISLDEALSHNFFDSVFEEDYEYMFEKISKHFQRDESHLN